jgi:hypothetical protein
MKALLRVEREFMKARIPLPVGDTVKVHVKVEGDGSEPDLQGAVIGRRGGCGDLHRAQSLFEREVERTFSPFPRRGEDRADSRGRVRGLS